MWDPTALKRVDARIVPIVFLLMLISLCVMASHDRHVYDAEGFLTPTVTRQLRGFLLGTLAFCVTCCFDYQKLRELTWILYIGFVFILLGLFLTKPIASVQRWYQIPGIPFAFQPSEFCKIVVILALSWYLEKKKSVSTEFKTAIKAGIIWAIPFFLILKQPDLGTAVVLFPICFVMFYFGGVAPLVLRIQGFLLCSGLVLISAIFSGLLPYETIRPYALSVVKEYQFERLNPDTHHQNAAENAIGIGGLFGTGFSQGSFSGGGWLPAPSTDSVFPAFGEEFGFIGLTFLLSLFYALIHCSFDVVAAARDDFGKLLAAGLSVYLAIHVLINVGMMTGMLPITGVPLILVTYGGSSALTTMIALGMLQSIYSRRFTFS